MIGITEIIKSGNVITVPYGMSDKTLVSSANANSYYFTSKDLNASVNPSHYKYALVVATSASGPYERKSDEKWGPFELKHDNGELKIKESNYAYDYYLKIIYCCTE